ncbi:uroporphyrinogen-III C-methyltransferase [Vibrio ostreicida]|uniref:uroporphyrinogen-III C-methyltransferase n=1 Tax=Vibrio ostreicida TaxID=526588 RepID=UPI000970FE76|nr:uroporphyrinogen-III C-methyltransferase [Vibrio ostreicida]
MIRKNRNNQVEPKTETPASTGSADEKQAKRGVKLGAIAIIMSLLFGGGLIAQNLWQSAKYQEEIEVLTTELQRTRTTVQESLSAAQETTLNKVAETNDKNQNELSLQKKSIELLQRELSKRGDHRPNNWVLAEADYLVKLAGHKLYLENDAVTARQLLESADQRIATLNDPTLIPLRQSMAKDITALMSIRNIDTAGLVLRIIALQQQVDALPIINATLAVEPEDKSVQISENIQDWKSNMMASLRRFSENVITVRTRDTNTLPLITVEQQFFLRENIKAKLDTAIKAVFLQQQEVYSSTLTTSQQWSASFFKQDANTVVEFDRALTQLMKQKVQIEYPETLETPQILSDVISRRFNRDTTVLPTEEQ